MSAAVVKDLYQSVIKPDAKPKTMKNLTTASTIIINNLLRKLCVRCSPINEANGSASRMIA